MSSEHATEQVPLARIPEGDTIQDPESGQWFTVTRTADGTTNVTQKHSDGDTTVIEGYRVYYGDERQVPPRNLLARSFDRTSQHPDRFRD